MVDEAENSDQRCRHQHPPLQASRVGTGVPLDLHDIPLNLDFLGLLMLFGAEDRHSTPVVRTDSPYPRSGPSSDA
jgi:hypothetical protein